MPDELIEYVELSPEAYLVDIRSGKSNKIYSLNIVWNHEKKEWMGITCNCGGWTNKGVCRHLKTAPRLFYEKYGIRPKKPASFPQLVPKYWLECSVCKSTRFHIKPPVSGKDGKRIIEETMVVCAICGRHYKL